jgi:Fur family transcriptional regulator, ferric uptake regulator
MARAACSRNTRQREVILEELRRVPSHPTAAGLYEIVRKRLPKISLGTVYRNLERLAAMGMIRKLELAGTQARFDGTPEHHDHIRCVGCGRVDDVCNVHLDLPGIQGSEWGGYEVLGHRLEFVGVCPQCRAAQGADGTGALRRPAQGAGGSGADDARMPHGDPLCTGGDRAVPSS